MPTMIEVQCGMILQTAINAELAIRVKTNNPTRARLSLYNTRKALGNVEFAQLQIRVSPDDPEGEIWIINLGKVNDMLAGQQLT
jgi:hypothetical protein